MRLDLSVFRFLVVFIFAISSPLVAMGMNGDDWHLLGESLFVSYNPLLKEVEASMKDRRSFREIRLQIDGDDVMIEKVQLLGSGPFFSANQSELVGIYKNGMAKSSQLPIIYHNLRRVRLEITKLQQTDEIVKIQIWAR